MRQLDSDRFDVRQKAGSRLQELVGMADLHNCLAEEFERVLVRVPHFIRGPLAARSLACANCRPTCRPRCPRSSFSGEDLDVLVCQLDDDRYAVRVARPVGWIGC